MANRSKRRSKGQRTGPRPDPPGPPTQPEMEITSMPPTSLSTRQPKPLEFRDRPEVSSLIEQIERKRGSRVITYFLSDGLALIAPDVLGAFRAQLRTLGKQERIDLWLHSTGGHTEVPYGIVQALRYYCSPLGVLITQTAHSAATHIALGADEIVMGSFSTLSPVDPSRVHPLLPKGENPTDPQGPRVPLQISVQDLKHAMEFVKNQAGEAGLTGEALAEVITALFKEVHPLAIGAIEQSYALAKLITTRLLSMHMDPIKESEEIIRLANALSDDYKSHSFPIGLFEAKNLGLKVVEAEDDLYDAMWTLLDHYRSIDRSPRKVEKGQIGGAKFVGTPHIQCVGHVDSTVLRFDCIGVLEEAQSGKLESRGSMWVPVTPAAEASAGDLTETG